MTVIDNSQIQEAIRRFDKENSADPRIIEYKGEKVPYELFYALRLSEWVIKLSPQASPALQLAARCQHLCRWQIPRDTYPMTRAGYLQWRADLKVFHSKKSSEILSSLGFSEDLIQQVSNLNLKKNLTQNPDTQTLEDALCLVTLQYQFDDLIRKTEHEKMISILQKTWKKMSPQAHEEALKLSYTPEQQALLKDALKN